MEDVLQVAGCEACGQMSVIEAGVFDMGSPEGEAERSNVEGPVRRAVSMAKFEMGRTEVTQSQWKAVMGSNPSHFKSCGDKCPVERVRWDDITGPNGFLARLNERLGLRGTTAYRLPSEAEWEYAARAGTSSPFWWGKTVAPGQANYDVRFAYAGARTSMDYRRKTVEADAFEANAWGLHNVHGNVWEWVQDCWHASYERAPSTGEEWKGDCDATRRVFRGGSMDSHPRDLRIAVRGSGDRGDRRGLGFRLARSL